MLQNFLIVAIIQVYNPDSDSFSIAEMVPEDEFKKKVLVHIIQYDLQLKEHKN
jgi:hypothetical protein